MSVNRIFKTGLLFIIAASLQGCVPSFDHPVVELTAAARDDRLLGLWEADAEYFKDMEKGDYGALLFLPCDAGYCITMYTVEKGRGDAVHLNGYAQVINGTGYLNYQFYEVDPQEEGFHLAQYQVMEDGSLALTLPDPKKLEQAIAEKTLPGEVSQEPDGLFSLKDIRVTADRDDLLRILQETDLFDSQPLGIFHPQPDGMVQKVKKALWDTSSGPAAESK